MGYPAIITSDQGSQSTSEEYTGFLKQQGIGQSMDGKARWVDNVIIERWFSSLKTEDIYINEYSSPKALRAGISSIYLFVPDCATLPQRRGVKRDISICSGFSSRRKKLQPGNIRLPPQGQSLIFIFRISDHHHSETCIPLGQRKSLQQRWPLRCSHHQ